MSFKELLCEKLVQYGPNKIKIRVNGAQAVKIKKLNDEYTDELRKMGIDITAKDAKWLWDKKYTARFNDIIDGVS